MLGPSMSLPLPGSRCPHSYPDRSDLDDSCHIPGRFCSNRSDRYAAALPCSLTEITSDGGYGCNRRVGGAAHHRRSGEAPGLL